MAAPTQQMLRGLALSCHPLPALAVTVLVAGMTVVAEVSAGRAALATAAVLAGQLSIGWSNDAIDAERDRAVHRADKPVSLGVVTRQQTAVAAGLAVIGSAALSAPLGWRVGALVLVGVACGWAYNLGVKTTPWSWLPYALAFGTLPAVATLASSDARWPAAWAVTTGAFFGVAAHFANVLPDLLDDEATGVRGLPHRVGASVSAVTGPLLLTAASFAILLGPAGHRSALRFGGLIATVVVAVWASIAARRNPGSQRYFFAVIAIALLDLTLVAVSGAALD